MRNKTTSIRRPEQRAAADEGRSTVGDLSRAIPLDQRISRRPQLAMFAGLFVLFVVLVALVAIFILPINTWRDQDSDLRELEEELDQLVQTNGEIAAESDRLESDDGIREAAGEELGYLDPGESRVDILAAPELPHNLPDGWPYNVAEQILEIRRAENSARSAD